jgi:catechol-2,3-dioxygenase
MPVVMSTAPLAPRLARVDLFVRNLERARHFYTRTLGLEMSHQEPGACFLAPAAGSFELRLFEHAPEGVEPPLAIGCRSIAFQVPSRDALLDVCNRLLGGRFTVLESGDAWAVHTKDPDGNRIEVFCRRTTAGGPRVERGSARTLSLADLGALRLAETR